MNVEEDRKFNKAARAIFKPGTDAKQLTDEAIEACKKQSIEPAELLNKPVDEFYDSAVKKGKVTTEQEELARVRFSHF